MIAAFKEVRAVKVLGRWGVIGLVCGVGLLTGCSSGEPEAADPTPVVEPSEAPESADPSPEPTAEESEEQHIAAAKQLVQEYLETGWALGNNGFKDLGSMARFWGTPQLAESMMGVYLSSYEAGEYTEGAGTIVSQTVLEYDGSGEYAQVLLDICVDFSGIRAFDGSGSLRERTVDRLRTKLLVVEQMNGKWAINETESNGEWVC